MYIFRLCGQNHQSENFTYVMFTYVQSTVSYHPVYCTCTVAERYQKYGHLRHEMGVTVDAVTVEILKAHAQRRNALQWVTLACALMYGNDFIFLSQSFRVNRAALRLQGRTTGLPTVDTIAAQILKKRHLTWLSRTADISGACVTEQFAYIKHTAHYCVVKTTLLLVSRASR